MAVILTGAILSLVRHAARHAWAVIAVSLALLAAATFYVAGHFAMSTDTGTLINPDTPWRRDGAAVEAAFPQLKDAIVVVVDGQTPELAEDGATRLYDALQTAPNAPLESISRPDGGRFFDQNGLLFGDLAQVQSATKALIDAQPMLGGLAADTSLHGIASTLDTLAKGAMDGEQDSSRLATPLGRLADAVEAKLAGKPTYFSWTSLFGASTGPLAPPKRRLLILHPRLSYGDLEPGAAAVALVQDQAAKLGVDAAHGMRIGITGEVPLADEEFATIREGMGLIGALMLGAMLACLWLAVRSARMVGAIMATILVGLVITLALGLLAVGRLNVLSVAFIPLFVGLGVDFGIQVAVRFNAERRSGADMAEALTRMAKALGEPLGLAAAAILLALAAFLPTDYTGIAELGIISGLGMVVALLLNLSLLPALLVLLRPAPPARDVGWAGAAPLDHWLHCHRRGVVTAFVAAMVLSIIALFWVHFDFNPLHLRDPATPAMREITTLTQDPDRTPNSISLLAPNAEAAAALARQLAQNPEVAQAITVDSFVPDAQPLKLALIEDAALLLDATVNPFALDAPIADDATTVAALRQASTALLGLAKARHDATGAQAARLASALARLAAATPEKRAQVSAMLVPPLAQTMAKIRASLSASTITRDNLPPEIRNAWLAKDGRALVQVTPSGNGADNATLERFTKAVLAIAPHATGLPVATQAAAQTVAHAFIVAGILALALVSGLLWLVLRSLREVAFTLAPVVLSGFLTLGTCAVIGQPLNFANIIAFPLLFGVGVAFHIYFVMAWRQGFSDLLQTSLARAVLCSALATGSAFGALTFSQHPGTASMGLILMISLVWTLVCALVFEPALLGPVAIAPPAQED
ncbi:hopanoid biosynthesis-associated RND transporter HpnN [Novosphingobium umbonatum]|uniref:Hopanoid biosynthesis-associated RND transporter HpnN n=1 Tax=Novosphingobium umbonatum TaxID=1908524 RepID=A0A437N6D0_9SPHN|nr:MMPL family transporter [Novosphingobium umbonatum]RVU05447.1 hopanoid biosynthesis-associated RND transporter HpnN [Novosphingobium umbonatum]